jgi:DNA-binding response OmpR family regulator
LARAVHRADLVMDSADDVLVVDDDQDIREVMEMVLSDCGYRVRTARHGAEALAAALDRRPGLVLLDMLMPVMEGWSCARALRERFGPSLPIVVMTAAEHAGKRGLEVGANAVLAKPFDMDELLAVVSRYVRPAAGLSSPAA